MRCDFRDDYMAHPLPPVKIWLGIHFPSPGFNSVKFDSICIIFSYTRMFFAFGLIVEWMVSGLTPSSTYWKVTRLQMNLLIQILIHHKIIKYVFWHSTHTRPLVSPSMQNRCVSQNISTFLQISKKIPSMLVLIFEWIYHGDSKYRYRKSRIKTFLKLLYNF